MDDLSLLFARLDGTCPIVWREEKQKTQDKCEFPHKFNIRAPTSQQEPFRKVFIVYIDVNTFQFASVSCIICFVVNLQL